LARLAIIQFTQSHSGFGGVHYNPGEKAAFTKDDAEEIVELGSGDIIEWRGEEEPVKREGIQSPAVDKMVTSPVQKKTDQDEIVPDPAPRIRTRRSVTLQEAGEE